MKFLSFLNDLGIIPNENTSIENDPSLRQGQELMDFNRHYTRQISPELERLEKTSMPGVGSVIEAMDNQKPKVAVPESENDDISKLENEYNKTLVEYNKAYQLFSESVLQMRKKEKDIAKYFGQAITSSDGNYKYVNDFGYTHKYSKESWANNAPSCPTDAISVDDELIKQFHTGPAMGSGQACGVAGKNVQNKDTQEISWVDIQGKRHAYSQELWESKRATCYVPIVTLSASEYNAIPEGGAMTSTDSCLQLDIDPAVWSKLQKLNDKLLKLSEELAFKLGGLVVEDIELQMELKAMQDKLSATVNQMKSDRNNINNYKVMRETTSGELEDAELNQRMRFIQMIAWFFALIAMIALTVRAYTGDSSKVMDYLGVIAAIIIVWVVSNAIYKHYMMSGKFL